MGLVTTDLWQAYRIAVNIECTMTMPQRLNLTWLPGDSTLKNHLAEVSKLTQKKCWARDQPFWWRKIYMCVCGMKLATKFYPHLFFSTSFFFAPKETANESIKMLAVVLKLLAGRSRNVTPFLTFLDPQVSRTRLRVHGLHSWHLLFHRQSVRLARHPPAIPSAIVSSQLSPFSAYVHVF